MISMDGRGRAMDNIFVERLCRTRKYEAVYLNDYEQVAEAGRAARSSVNGERMDRIIDALFIGYKEQHGQRNRTLRLLRRQLDIMRRISLTFIVS